MVPDYLDLRFAKPLECLAEKSDDPIPVEVLCVQAEVQHVAERLENFGLGSAMFHHNAASGHLLLVVKTRRLGSVNTVRVASG